MARSLDEVRQQLIAQVSFPLDGAVKADGRIHRFKPEGLRQKKGWYRVHECTDRSGRTFYAGTFGVWSGDDQGTIKIEASGEWSPEERLDWQAKQKELEAAAAKDRAQLQERTADRAQKLWTAAREEGASAYLDRKRVRAFGVRFAFGKLLVPMRDLAGRLWGLQWIAPEKDAAGSDKKFSTGATWEHHFHLLGEVKPDLPIAFAEGYATAASVHMATGWPVVCAFVAGNLELVVADWRKLYPDARLIVCGDDDRHLTQKLCKWLREYGVETTPADWRDARLERVWPLADGKTVELKATWKKDLQGGWRIEGAVEEGGKTHVRRIINTGRAKALSAAKRHRCAVGFPRFAASDASGTDFNDLHVEEGLDEVRAQLEAALADGIYAGRASRDAAAARAEKDRAGPQAAEQEESRWRTFQRRFVLIYGTTTVWDAEARQIVKLEALKVAFRDMVDRWLDSPWRRMIPKDNLVFDPTGRAPADTHINLFNGFPLQADGSRPTGRLVEHLFNLCGEDQGLFDWVAKWLAYPLQHPGAKMRTALVMHGRREGTGKSYFFDVMREIYGRYARTVTQLQLQSEFTDWLSQMLFCVAEEVVTQQDRKHHKGLLKNVITNPVLQINEKMMPLRQESNHINFVFLSNELQPVVLDEFDRRYTVIYADIEREQEYFHALKAEIEDGGAAGFYHWLLSLDLEGFDEFTRPFENAARRRLINLGKSAERRFLDLWWHGYTELPRHACRAKDLYEGFRAWCRMNGERFIPNSTVFGTAVGLMPDIKKRTARVHTYSDTVVARNEFEGATPAEWRGMVYVMPQLVVNDSGSREEETADEMIVNRVQEFQRALASFHEGARRSVQ